MTARKQKGISTVVHADGTHTVHFGLVRNGQWRHTLRGTGVEIRLPITVGARDIPNSSHHVMHVVHEIKSRTSFWMQRSCEWGENQTEVPIIMKQNPSFSIKLETSDGVGRLHWLEAVLTKQCHPHWLLNKQKEHNKYEKWRFELSTMFWRTALKRTNTPFWHTAYVNQNGLHIWCYYSRRSVPAVSVG